MLIAVIATFHILPSHVATGAFWITYYIERKAYAEERPELLEFLKKFTLSILIFCFVTGSPMGSSAAPTGGNSKNMSAEAITASCAPGAAPAGKPTNTWRKRCTTIPDDSVVFLDLYREHEAKRLGY